MKKILILGVGNAQIDAINYCKEKGLEVHGCSYSDKDSGVSLCDKFVQLDIKDVANIEKYVTEQQIDYVYSVGSDLAVPSVMKVCEDLNLKHFISSETAHKCHSKTEMRAALGHDFEGNLKFLECSTVEEACTFSEFPAMMKPIDSQGQRGCYRVDSAEDIRENFEKSLSFSVKKRVIIEQFVDGPEVSVNAFMVDGVMKFALVSDRLVFDELPGGIIREHRLPSVFTTEETAKRVVKVAAEAAKILKITDGPAYYQIKLDGDIPRILEITPRLDGCHMWNLINRYCGVNLLDLSFRLLMDEPVEIPEEIHPEGAIRTVFMCEEPGKTFNREKYDISSSEYHMWYYQTGDVVKSMNGYMEKCGYRIIRD